MRCDHLKSTNCARVGDLIYVEKKGRIQSFTLPRQEMRTIFPLKPLPNCQRSTEKISNYGAFADIESMLLMAHSIDRLFLIYCDRSALRFELILFLFFTLKYCDFNMRLQISRNFVLIVILTLLNWREWTRRLCQVIFRKYKSQAFNQQTISLVLNPFGCGRIDFGFYSLFRPSGMN